MARSDASKPSNSPGDGLPTVVLVTGAARGMGATHASILAGHGVAVALADVADTEPAARKIRDAGGRASTHLLDVTDPRAWDIVVAEVVERHGSLGGLVNNAGISRRLTLMETDDATWERILRINLSGPFHGMKAVAPVMRDQGGGSIVNVSSISGQIGYFSAAYSSSKWGLTGLSKAAAGNLAAWNIRVNSLHPGLISTPLLDDARSLMDVAVKSVPLGRLGSSADVTEALLFLLSDRSSYMTGTEVTVDGGLVSNGLFHRVVTEHDALQREVIG
jgi:3alpha(or 20beta)-hydroxysteroid dehydrogenase